MNWYQKRIVLILLFVAVILILVIKLNVDMQENLSLQRRNQNSFTIKKTNDGYNVYKNNKLEWEFTKQNTDSLSLETLKMIHEGDN